MISNENPFKNALYLIDHNRGHVVPQEISNMLTKIKKSNEDEKIVKVAIIITALLNVNVQPNDYHYRVITDIYIRVRQNEKLLDLFKEMKENNVTPSPFTSNKIIRGLGKTGRIGLVVKCYTYMKENKFPIDQINLNAFIAASAYCKDYEMAAQFKKEMLKREFSTDVYTWTPLMEVAFKTGQFLKGVEHFDSINVPDKKAYELIISECLLYKDIERAKTYLKKMVEQGLKPEIKTVQRLIDLLYQQNKRIEASPFVKLKLQLLGIL